MSKDNDNLRLVVMPNIAKFGELVDQELKLIRGHNVSHIVNLKLDRFSNGEGKATLIDSIRGKDVFLLSDVGNYGKESIYMSRGYEYLKSPDDHFQDIKRVISAMNGRQNALHVVMPLLYQSRQDKRKACESLDCSEALRELERHGVNGVITFDVHNPAIENALANCSFDNLYPTYSILSKFIDEEEYNKDDLMIVAPDTGAMERALYYADSLGVDAGLFHKRRDFSQVVDGKNPIVEHKFLGNDVAGKDLIITDDMIASGTSILEVATDMKVRGANKIYLVATFPLFTEGNKSIEAFDRAYNAGIFHRLYTTNVTYVPQEIKDKEWFIEVDCSKYLAKIINAIYERGSIRVFLDGKTKLQEKIIQKKLVRKDDNNNGI